MQSCLLLVSHVKAMAGCDSQDPQGLQAGQVQRYSERQGPPTPLPLPYAQEGFSLFFDKYLCHLPPSVAGPRGLGRPLSPRSGPETGGPVCFPEAPCPVWRCSRPFRSGCANHAQGSRCMLRTFQGSGEASSCAVSRACQRLRTTSPSRAFCLADRRFSNRIE